MNCTHAQGAALFEAVTGQDLISSQMFHQLTIGLVVGQSIVEMCSAVNPMGLVTYIYKHFPKCSTVER